MFRQLSVAGRELVHGFLHLLYPGLCVVCGRPLAREDTHFCPACRLALRADTRPTCPRCASNVGPFVPLDKGCPRCQGVSFHFEGVLRLGPYEGALRELVLRLKHWSGEGLAEALGELWAEHDRDRLLATGARVVVPVPLHWRRRIGRGYNQSEVLARALAGRLDLPCRPRWLRRVRHTPKQTAQTPAMRRENVRGAFHARPREGLKGKAVLLVDDVLTTGTTCSEAARALCQAGAARVMVAVLAHDRAP